MWKSVRVVAAIVLMIVLVSQVFLRNPASLQQIKAASPGETAEVSSKEELLNALNNQDVGNISATTDIDLEKNNGNTQVPTPISREVTVNLGGHTLKNIPSKYFEINTGAKLTVEGGSMDGGMQDVFTLNACFVLHEGGTLVIDEGKTYKAGEGETILYYSKDWVIGKIGNQGKLYQGDLIMSYVDDEFFQGVTDVWMSPDVKPYQEAGRDTYIVMKGGGWWKDMNSLTFGARSDNLNIANETNIPVFVEDTNQKLFVGVKDDPGLVDTSKYPETIEIYSGMLRCYLSGAEYVQKPEEGNTLYGVYLQREGSDSVELATLDTARNRTLAIPNYAVSYHGSVAPLTEAQSGVEYTCGLMDDDGGIQPFPDLYNPETEYLNKPICISGTSGYELFIEGGESFSPSLLLEEEGKNITVEFYAIYTGQEEPMEYGREWLGKMVYSYDGTGPVIKSVSKSPNVPGATKEDITLTIHAEDAMSGLDAEPYSFDGGITWQSDNFKVFTSWDYLSAQTIQVKDSAGNITKYDQELAIKVDKEAPILMDMDGNTIDGRTYPIGLSGNVLEDSLKSLTLYEGPTASGTGTKVEWNSDLGFSIESKERDYQYTLVAEDEVGFKATATFRVDAFQKDLTATADAQTGTYGDTLRTSVVFKNIGAESIQIVKVGLDAAGTADFNLLGADEVGLIGKNSSNTNIGIELKERQKAGTYAGILRVDYINTLGQNAFVKVNISAEVLKRKLTMPGLNVTKQKIYDKTAQVQEIKGELLNILPADNGKITVSAVYDTPDAGKDKKITVSFHATQEMMACYELPETIVYSDGEITKAAGTGSLSIADIYLGEDPNYQIESVTNGVKDAVVYFKKAGAADQAYISEMKAEEGRYLAKAIFPATRNYLEVEAYGEFTVTQMQAPQDIYTLVGTVGNNGWYTSDVTLVPKSGYKVSAQMWGKYDDNILITSSQDAHPLYFKKDTGAVTNPVQIEKIQIDKTPPECTVQEGIQFEGGQWHKFLENITFGIYKNKPLTVTVKGHDDESGITDVFYLLSEKMLKQEEVASSKDFVFGDTAVLDAENGRKFVVYGKLVNGAGLVTYLSSDGMVMDKDAPNISGVQKGKSYKVDVLEITISDYSLKEVLINDKTCEIVNNQVKLKLKAGDKEVSYKLKAVDACGNSKETSFTLVKKGKSQTAKEVEIGSEGKVYLKKGEPYRFASGKWGINGEITIYYGSRTFYVIKDGDYVIIKK